MGTTTVGTIGLNMVLNSAGFRRSLQNVQSQANTAGTRISNSFKKIGAAIAAAFSAKMIVSFGKACIDLGSDLAEVQNVVDVTFTTMSDKVNEWAVNAQKAYGLSETMAKKYVGTFGSMAEAFGFTEKQSYDMATALAGLTGDVASFYNLDQDLAYTKLKSVFSGETETLKDLGIVMTQSALDNYALANGYGKTVSQMTEAEKVTLRYNFVLGQLKNATGDFTRTQDSWANQTRILSLRIDSLKATIGQGLINTFTPVIKVLNTLIDRLSTVSEKFKALTEQIFGNAGGSTAGGVDTAIADSASSAESLTNEANNSSAALDSIADSAEKAKRSVAGFDKLNIITQDTTTATNTSSDDKSTAVSNGKSSPLVTAMDNLTSSWNAKSKKLLDSVKGTMGKIKTAISEVGKSWGRVWNNGTGQKFLDNIKNLISDIIDNVGSIADAFTKAWNKAGLGNSVVQSIIDRADSLIGLIDVIAEDFGKIWNNGAGERIWGNILSTIRNCNNATKTLRDKIKEAWDKNDTGKKIWQDVLGIVEDITGFMEEMSAIRLEWLENLDLSPIMESVEKLGGAFRELLQACGDKLKTAYKNILLPLAKWTIEKGVPKLVEMLADAFELLGKFIKKIPVSVLAGVAAAIGTVVAAFKAFKIAKEVKKNFDVIKAAFLNFKDNVLTKHPYAVAITAITAAVAGLISAMQTYSNEQWSNSSLKKEVDKTSELADEWGDLADEMSTKIDEINDTELTMKVDFENVDKMKDRLKEIIDDGTIDENEEGDYKTIVDLLGEKVDGFTDDWNTLTLEEIDGKIVIKDNIDDVNQKLDDLVANWEIAQAKMTFREVYSSLQTDVAKQKIQIDVEDKNNNVDEAKQELIDYIFEKSSLSKKESKLLANELIKQKGDFEKTNKSLKSQFDNGNISSSEYENLHFLLYKNSKHSFESAFGWKNYTEGVSCYIKEATESISEMSEEQSRAKDTYDGLADSMNEYESALSTINGGSKNYNDYIKLSTEYGLSHDAVLSLLKDDGITTWEELEKAAKKSNDEVKGTLDETDNKFQESSRRAKAASNNTTVTIEKHTLKAKSSVENNLANGVPNAISTMWQRIKGVFTDGDGFVKIKDAIWGVFKNAINALISGINSLIRKPFDMLNGAFDNVRNFEFFGQKVFDWLPKIEAPQIPKLAKGGIVKAPTLAVVGDNAGANTGNPEVIAPLNKLQQMINTSSGQDVVILSQILDYLKRIYELFVVFRNNGGNMYEFVAKLNGSTLFAEIVNQNELYKKRHNGKSAFA